MDTAPVKEPCAIRCDRTRKILDLMERIGERYALAQLHTFAFNFAHHTF